MPFTIIRQDITKMRVDAIVNAANTRLIQGGGVCGAIFKAAGAQKLQEACDRLAHIEVGEAVITPGFDLPARYIIHTAGPIYVDGRQGEEALLRASYRNSLMLAFRNSCQSIAFPLISSGIYGYPRQEALRAATAEIRDFLKDHEMDVFLAVFDRASFVAGEKLMGRVASFIDEHYVAQRDMMRRIREDLKDADNSLLFEIRSAEFVKISREAPALGAPRSLEEIVSNLDASFSQALLRLIDAKGMTDPEVYKRANLDRKLFSKIRTGKNDTPSKRTALALAVALELSLPETDDLLRRAGHALSRSQKFDVIVAFFILSGNYDIYEINEVLFAYDQPLLGGS